MAVKPTTGSIGWERFPDPIPAQTASLLLDRPVAWIQKQVSEQGFTVHWVKGRLMMRRDDARLLERVVAKEANT
jgi:hypothetical protein